ncbi:GTPase HflX [bacterium]|nr:GTPase HflX [bacterium]
MTDSPFKGILIFPQRKIDQITYSQDIIKENITLLKNINIQIKKTFEFKLKNINPATYIGKGKLQEIYEYTSENDIEIIVFVNELSPTQKFNIEKLFATLNIDIIDREEAIISIFSKNAKTRFAKIQVELAYFRYLLPRLKGNTQFSRTGAGISTRGPGEQKLEMDRRYILKRIAHLKDKIKKMKAVFIEQSKKRKDLFTIAICGYTNSGKTTLLNKITHSHGKTLKRPFTTLDTLTKKRWLVNETVIFTDTIGFIRDLPKNLLEAFEGTIDVINNANIIIELYDLSAADIGVQINTVGNVLENILKNKIKHMVIFNKIDKKMGKLRHKSFEKRYSEAFFISAKENIGIEKFIDFLKIQKEFVKYK